MEDLPGQDYPPQRVLKLFDCVCIIVGTIIGAGIFQFPGVVASYLPSLPWFLGVWIFGGFIALLGAICFAELTTTYPDAGGDYGYLKRAYHPHLAFAFSWTAFWVIRPGNIGALAMIFGKFCVDLLEPTFSMAGPYSALKLAIGAVMACTALNWLGVVFSKTAQNILTTAKVLGILIVLGGALICSISQQDSRQGPPSPPDSISQPLTQTSNTEQGPAQALNWSSFWLAMVFVMFTFGGWNDIAFVAREVEDPQRNLLRSLVLGTLGVLAIYLLVNVSLLIGLGLRELAELGEQNPTAVFVERTIGASGAALFSGLVCISCLGGINAMIFTSPRIYWATAQDYPALTVLTGSSSDGNGWRSIILQGLLTLVFMIGFGRSDGGIDNLVAATAPYFWSFLALTVLALIINRRRHRGQFEGFRVPCYPLPPILFATACGFMMFHALAYLRSEGLGTQAILIGVWVAAGIGLSFRLQRQSQFK